MRDKSKTAMYWDIENIAIKIALTKLARKFKAKRKVIVHNDKNQPYSSKAGKQLLASNWKIEKTSCEKNAADLALISTIYEDLKQNIFETFVIISEDHIFAEVIANIMKAGKKVFLITKDDKNIRLLKSILNFLHGDKLTYQKLLIRL